MQPWPLGLLASCGQIENYYYLTLALPSGAGVKLTRAPVHKTLRFWRNNVLRTGFRQNSDRHDSDLPCKANWRIFNYTFTQSWAISVFLNFFNNKK